MFMISTAAEVPIRTDNSLVSKWDDQTGMKYVLVYRVVWKTLKVRPAQPMMAKLRPMETAARTKVGSRRRAAIVCY